ncbi:MAG: SH3 domain-containing protein [Cyclobacteriaceae bacterium]|nr:SH3 domain-containing protein [Cyclobacteriaceae bacterium]MDW8330053.1 SH3 domain-containing protein [Cyclobacteriaceae bacterium]
MQNTRIKLLLLFILLTFFSSVCRAQTEAAALQLADSLFHSKKYVQSLEYYEQLLSKGYQSPAMLLRMAYVEEGLQRYARALYYLHRYYQLEPDDKVWNKITSLAAQHRAAGYEMKLGEFGLTKYRLHRPKWIMINFCMAAMLAVVMLLSRNKKIKRKAFIVQMAFVLVLFVQINMPFIRYAIVAEDGTPVMKGPSAAADVLEVLQSGTRLQVKGKTDIWLKVINHEQTGFVRSGNLLVLP